MAKKLKAAIFGITNVIVTSGAHQEELFSEISRLIKFLQAKNITPLFYGNRSWTHTDDKGKRDLEEFLREEWGNIQYLNANRDNLPPKQKLEATHYVLNRYGWDPAEVVYIGNTEEDMQSAVNGGLLFLNATWYGLNSEYGIKFKSPKEVARFIDTFCLRDSLWHYAIEDADLQFYALAPYSTYYQEFEFLSNDARDAAKWGGGHPDFWTQYLWSTIYFSEIYKEVNYIALIPGHNAGAGNPIMQEPMAAFAKCFRQTLLSDLIIRHTTIPKSSAMRNRREILDHSRQLKSIKLNQFPMRTLTKPYKNCPLTKGKTVLVIDDICTQGFTLEAARKYIDQTGAKVICMSWLKTVNKSYQKLVADLKFNPFEGYNLPAVELKHFVYQYEDHIIDTYAPKELSQKLKAYDSWKWPAGI
jgi:hypothetical protein